ncbi:MAG: zf-HC2 domain-containing protein [Gemmatimonadales bacterium]
MQHPDDGLIEEYLDGELASPERTELEAHLTGCAACRERVETSRRFLAEASQLIDGLGEPVPPIPLPAPRLAPAVARRPAGPPVRLLAWAATLVIAAGLGYASGTWRARTLPTPEAQGKGGMPQVIQPASPPAGASDDQRVPSASPPTNQFAEERERRDEDQVRRREAEPSSQPAIQPSEFAKRADALRDEDAAGRRENPPPSQPAIQPSELAKSAVANSEPPAVTLDDAVRLLGGSIRLIDGMEVEKVEIEDPAVVVLTYRDAAGNPIELRQRRPLDLARQAYAAESQRLAAAADRAERSRAAAPAPAPAPSAGALDAAVMKDKEEDGGLGWTDSAGFRLLLRADADADSLRRIRTRIR